MHTFIVPSSSSNNVRVIYSSTTNQCDVDWCPRNRHRNGIIVAFEILYIPLNTFESVLVQGMVNTSASSRSVEINSLEEYVQYNVSVREYTSIGPGPFSSPVTERTLENGRVVFIIYCFVFILISSCFSVPSSSPSNVTIVSVSLTSIGVMWENVQEIDENGVIIAFEILYIPLETFIGLVPKLVNTSASKRTVTLNNLEQHLLYNISVRAVGAGPFSPFITQKNIRRQ